MIYNNIEYAKSRLSGSVIMVKNRPAYVTPLLGGRMEALDLINQEVFIFLLEDKEYDILPVKLGFINRPKGCVYSCRTAKRQWKQGLSHQSFMVTGGEADILLLSRELGQCIKNIYPTLEEAYDLSTEERGVAFSRNFFIREGCIYNRNRRIIGELEHEKIILDNKYTYLKEQLKEYS